MDSSKFSIIHPEATIGKNVIVGAFTTIAANVEIGEGTWIGQNVVIEDGVKIGNNCKVFHGAILGSIPQDLKFGGEESMLIIGDNVIVREYCTLNRGTKASYKTTVGSNTMLMSYVHIAHDCIIGSNVIIANAVNMGGHVEIGDYAVIGGMIAIHQFVKIGEGVMIGGGSLVRKDVPPYIKAAREPLSYVGVNSIGLQRRGFDKNRIGIIQDIYRILFVNGLNTNQAISKIESEISESDEKKIILDSIKDMDRGIIRGYNG